MFASTKQLGESTANLRPEEVEVGVNNATPKDPKENTKAQPTVNENKSPPKLGLALNLKNLRAAAQKANEEDAKKTDAEKPTTEKPTTEKTGTDKPATEKTATEKPVVKAPAIGGGGGFGKGLLARLKEAAAKEKADEANNNSEVNSSKLPLVGAKVEFDKEATKQVEVKEPGEPPAITRGESGKKSTFSKWMGKLGTKKNEAENNDMKRVNSIKQKLLDEDIDETDIPDDFDKGRFKRFKQKVHLILYHPECSNWVYYRLLI